MVSNPRKLHIAANQRLVVCMHPPQASSTTPCAQNHAAPLAYEHEKKAFKTFGCYVTSGSSNGLCNCTHSNSRSRGPNAPSPMAKAVDNPRPLRGKAMSHHTQQTPVVIHNICHSKCVTAARNKARNTFVHLSQKHAVCHNSMEPSACVIGGTGDALLSTDNITEALLQQRAFGTMHHTQLHKRQERWCE